MTRWEAQVQYAANLLVGGTGIVYAVMRYGMEPVDEWAVIHHPWQPHVQHLHLLTAPLLVFACGLIWRRHVADNLERGERRGRRSVPGLLLALVPMTLSGYLIQTTAAESWRQAWVGVHLVASAAWILALLGHVVGPIRSRLRRLPRETGPRRSTANREATLATVGADGHREPASRVDRSAHRW
jgi:hypothetical protein